MDGGVRFSGSSKEGSHRPEICQVGGEHDHWIKRKEQRTGEQVKDILDRESVWIYLHDLSMKGIGKYTPKGVVNAIRYFGEALEWIHRRCCVAELGS